MDGAQFERAMTEEGVTIEELEAMTAEKRRRSNEENEARKRQIEENERRREEERKREEEAKKNTPEGQSPFAYGPVQSDDDNNGESDK